MERLAINQADVERNRDLLRAPEAGYETPCPGSLLALDDDVMWLDFIGGRILWGHPDPMTFYCYCPDIFGDSAVPLDATYVTDRAPVDPEATGMPIWPEPPPEEPQQQQGQGDEGERQLGGAAASKKQSANDPKKALKAALASLSPEAAKRARDQIRALRPDLLR